MDYTLEDLINIPLLQELQEKLNTIYSFPSAIVDNKGKILTAVAWQDICTKFHRVHPACERDCVKSDKYILEHINEANPAVSYRCPRGLIDSAIPIIIDGKHLGNFFTGQFFLEKPDMDFFRSQAEIFGFNEKEYLEAVEKTPIWNQDRLNQYLDFIKDFIELIAGFGLKNLKEIEANKTLEIINKKLNREIEERKHVEEELKKSEIKYKTLFETLPIGISISDKAGNVKECNKESERLLGISAEVHKQRKIADDNWSIIRGDGTIMPVEEYASVIALKENKLVENVTMGVVKGSDKVSWINVNAAPIPHEDFSLAIAYIDVTKQKQIEEDLRINNARFELSMDAANMAWWEMELPSGNVTFSERKTEMLGYTKEQFKSYLDFMTLVHPDDYDNLMNVMRKHINGEINKYEAEYRILTKSNGYKWFYDIGSVTKRDSSGAPIIVSGIVMDISERKLAEEKYKISEVKYYELYTMMRLMSDTMPDLLWAKNLSKQFIFANKAVCTKLLNAVDTNEVIGKNDLFFAKRERDKHPENPNWFTFGQLCVDSDEVTLREMKEMQFDEFGYVKGKFLYLDVHKAPMFNKEGNLIGIVGTARDITERMEMENALTESNLRYKTFFDQGPDGIVVIDPKTAKFIEFNDQACLQLGYSRDEFKQLSVSDIDFIENGNEVKEHINKVIIEGRDDFETTHLTKYGELRNVSVTAQILEIAGKKVYHCIWRDITNRKRAEEALRESEERYRLVINNLKAGVVVHAPNTSIIKFNSKAMELLGLSADQLLGKFSIDPDWCFVNENNQRLRTEEYPVSLVIAENKPFNNMTVGIHRSRMHDIVWGEVNGFPVFKSNGELSEVIISFIDITERKKAELDLQNSELQHGKMVSNIGDVIVVVDKDGINKYKSPNVEKIFGWKIEDLIGKNTFEVVHPLDLPAIKMFFNSIINQPQATGTTELRYRCKDGSYKWIELTVVNMFDDPNICGVLGNYHDITQRKLVENSLRESEEKYRTIFDYSPIGLLSFDKNGIITACNNNFVKIIGSSLESIVGLNLLQLRDKKLVASAREALLGNNGFYEDLYSSVTAKKSSQVRVLFAPIKYGDEQIEGGVGIIEDVTDRKLAQEALLEAEWKFRALFEKGPIGVAYHKMIYDNSDKAIDYLFIDANERYIELTGVDPRNKTVTQAFPNIENDPFDWIGTYGNVARTGKSIRFEQFLQTNSRWYDCVAYSYKPDHFVVAFLEITKNKKIEENLRKLSRAVEQSQVSIVITNKGAIIEYVNPKFLDVTGYSMDEVIGKNPRVLKSGEFTDHDYKEMWDLLTSGKEWSGIFHNKKKNGELFWESATISPIKNEQGQITNYVAVKEDITAKKEMELSLQQALERAEETNRLKSNFLANMNHELRTPLNGILGFAGFLTDELQDKDHVKMASAILNSGKRLSETLNLILDLSNVEAEKIEISNKRLEVVSIIKDVAGLFNGEALKKNLDYQIVANAENIYANLDEQLFPRVIHNLIDNAIKYTDKGSVVVETGVEHKDNNNQFYVKITDTGIGIPKDKIDIIWDAFRQVSEGLNRGYEGTGLGLTIAQKITRFMHGSIEVDSELGKGSVFIAKFPAIAESILDKPATKIELDVIAPANKDNIINELLNILYVEDDIINQNVVKLFLKNKYLIDTADDALSALQMIQQKKYDIILMDINLGRGMNGMQITEEIRKNQNYINTPVIAVTAYTTEADKIEFYNAGCTHYLAKPFLRNDLLKLLENVVN